ncbi:MAG TPA: class I SAM-dependent methyltransferase [Longimicrobiales bacterium]
MERQAHWDAVYATKAPEAVSWYQADPALSLELIARAGLRAGASVLDVGSGATLLVDSLLELGFRVTALDVSPRALEVLAARLGERAAAVTFVAGDVTAAALPAAAYDLWHDRAVLHFLTGEAERRAYVRQLLRCLAPGGHALIATFDLDGPVKCSGLDVRRYSPETLAELLGPELQPLEVRREAHVTPAGATQHFQYSLFRRAR